MSNQLSEGPLRLVHPPGAKVWGEVDVKTFLLIQLRLQLDFPLRSSRQDKQWALNGRFVVKLTATWHSLPCMGNLL